MGEDKPLADPRLIECGENLARALKHAGTAVTVSERDAWLRIAAVWKELAHAREEEIRHPPFMRAQT